MKKLSFLFVYALLFGLNSDAQNETDALRLSNYNVIGTARYQGLGGAFTALGVDLTTTATNPAGIAVSRNTQFVFTPVISGIANHSDLNGMSNSDFRLNLNVGNWGFSSTIPYSKARSNGKGLRSISVAITYNRLQGFHAFRLAATENSTSSLLDSYVQNLNFGGGTPSGEISQNAAFGWDENLAYQTYLINPDSSISNNYYHIAGKGNSQTYRSESRGRIGETNITLGTNISDKLYVGGGLGVFRVIYDDRVIYSETDEKNQIKDFNSFILNRNLRTTGSGYNLKFGAIFRSIHAIRAGVSIVTPTFFQLSDAWSANLSSVLDTASYFMDSPLGNYNYALYSATRVNSGVAVVVGTSGLISADYEFVSYNTARLRAPDYTFLNENNATRLFMRSTGNVRLGTEWKIGNMSVRAGLALLASPYKNSPQNFDRTNYSVGVGYSGKIFFCDATFVLSRYKYAFTLYELNSPGSNQLINFTQSTGNAMVSLGFRF